MIAIGMALKLAGKVMAPKAQDEPTEVLLTAVATVGSEEVEIKASTQDEADSLDQLVEDFARYGAFAPDVVAMTRQRHADDGLDLSRRFRDAVEGVIAASEAHPGLRATLTKREG